MGCVAYLVAKAPAHKDEVVVPLYRMFFSCRARRWPRHSGRRARLLVLGTKMQPHGIYAEAGQEGAGGPERPAAASSTDSGHQGPSIAGQQPSKSLSAPRKKTYRPLNRAQRASPPKIPARES